MTINQANVTNSHAPLPSAKTARQHGTIRLGAEALRVGESFTVSGVKRKTVTTRLREVSIQMGREFSVGIVNGGFQVTRVR